MKRPRLLTILSLLVVAVTFWQCPSDPPPAQDPKDALLEKLSKTWNTTSQTIDSQPETGHDGFSITITSTPGQPTFNYTTSGRPSGPTPWAPSGTFTFENDFNTTLRRDDGTIVTYSVTDTQLQLNFTYNGAGYTGSRITVVQGDWTFNFGL